MELRMQQRLLQSSTKKCAHLYEANIPDSYGFLRADSNDWQMISTPGPSYRRGPYFDGLISEKIPPLPQAIKMTLRDTLFNNMDPETRLAIRYQKNYIIRPYLGRRLHSRDADPDTTKTSIRITYPPHIVHNLGNTPIHLDQMEHLGINPRDYAIAMADALSVMHWSAKIDANDVEFVLASPRSNQHLLESGKSTSMGSIKFTKDSPFGEHSMWLLDFDCCRDMTMDEAGLDQACKSFWCNEPFYPRPGSEDPMDQMLWEIFWSHFLMLSSQILQHETEEVQSLPRSLMDRIIETKGQFKRGGECYFLQ